jgi:hypothetical protein
LASLVTGKASNHPAAGKAGSPICLQFQNSCPACPFDGRKHTHSMNFFNKKRTREQEQACAVIDSLLETISILSTALAKGDDDEAHEAVSVLLMQCMSTYGPDHPVMQQFFPVMDVIKTRIDSMELEAALRQTKLLERQLHEVKNVVLGKQ